jgi:hypothetical protein
MRMGGHVSLLKVKYQCDVKCTVSLVDDTVIHWRSVIQIWWDCMHGAGEMDCVVWYSIMSSIVCMAAAAQLCCMF